MGEWPDGWFRGPGSEDGPAGRGADASADKTVNISAGAGTGAASQRAVPPGSWPAQPPVSSGGGAARYGGGLTAPARSPAWSGGRSLPGFPGWRGWLRPKRIFRVLAVIVALLLVA